MMYGGNARKKSTWFGMEKPLVCYAESYVRQVERQGDMCCVLVMASAVLLTRRHC